MKVKRFIIEYANSKIKLYEKLTKEYPAQASDYAKMINYVDRAVWQNSRGYITDDETIRLIMESAERGLES